MSMESNRSADVDALVTDTLGTAAAAASSATLEAISPVELTLDPEPEPREGDGPEMLLSVIVPARNEADTIAACLQSLVTQSEPGFLLGEDWELLVVDDGSTDETRRIALEFLGATVLEAPPLREGWTGKANALWFAANRAKGKWLLFTDADTVHEPGNLRRAMHEAGRHRVTMLSYSPRQRVRGFWQRALMPLVFAELAQKYPPHLVNLPDSKVAAANGQFLMADRAVYMSMGGHETVRGDLVEDLELAQRWKAAHHRLRFRYAPDALSTRMYRSFGSMYEGWKKNLATLFPDAFSRAMGKLAQVLLLFGLPALAIWLYVSGAQVEIVWALGLWWAWRFAIHCSRVSKANFSMLNTLLSPLALPLFGLLLLDSWRQKASHGKVAWKGRSYPA
jgi:glycosyltransferase involved in cell wall biosynthesis